MDRQSKLLNFFSVYVICCLFNIALASKCHGSNLCCPGINGNCPMEGTSLKAIYQNSTDKPCYCHHTCLKIGDCCSGFKEACDVRDCVVSKWGPWSACNSDCGPGVQKRSRVIESAAENGGKHCPRLIQHRGCQGTKCHKRNPKTALKEVALLLSAELSEWRHKNDSYDLRANLRLRKHHLGHVDNSAYDISKEYCITFTIMKASPECIRKSSRSELLEGSRVCVQCQTSAFRPFLDYRCEGDGGAEGMITRWSLLSSPHCYGKWIRTKKTGSKCDASLCQPKPHFIFI
ncbi:somatomedin-B and thrombospondin type-1 domain-containing protein-like [Chelonus insularis]|uniref:somatomedin-B and thrombospondin type-1 domain-containing protein-like n=1 Tax=Chelonus insularis TaxID=460826 RepID=UPI00158857AF|nr:somatomedin-B and thrombospondin type-1 domain-containing protein-like [Chelonus insularis]